MRSVSSNPNPLLCGWRLPGNVQHHLPFYWFCKQTLRIVVPLAWDVRVYNRCHEPADGGVAYICNHQSFFDPIVMSYFLKRPMNYMARDTLFHIPLFGRLIQSVNAFPVRRNTSDIAGMKEAMRRIKDNGQVVIFAEGTRTIDGRIGPLLPGAAMLAQRFAKWTVPVTIDGAFEAWPRTKLLPCRGKVIVQYGPPIHRDEAKKMEPEFFIEQVRRTLIEMQTDIRRRMGRPALHYEKA